MLKVLLFLGLHTAAGFILAFLVILYARLCSEIKENYSDAEINRLACYVFLFPIISALFSLIVILWQLPNALIDILGGKK